MEFIFQFSFWTLAYVYAGYPLLVWGLARLFGHEPVRGDITPMISLLIPAKDEEVCIEAKIRNSLALDYPKERLEIIVASNGSRDRTDAIARRFAVEGVSLESVPEPIGKSAMLTRTVPKLRGEIVVCSDATCELEPQALRMLVRNFADPAVGCVSGHYRMKSRVDLRAQGEGLYWRYETFIKRQESRLSSVLGVHGPLYAIRKRLFPALAPHEINDDYLIPMRVIEQGYRVVHDFDAVVWEPEVVSVAGEFVRRRRIAAGNCQQIATLRHLLNPARGWVALSFFSHKVLRTAAPVLLIALLISSIGLPTPWSLAALALQFAFYASAFAGYLCYRQARLIRWLSPPFYFCFGNLAMLAGLLRYCFSSRRYTWERAR